MTPTRREATQIARENLRLAGMPCAPAEDEKPMSKADLLREHERLIAKEERMIARMQAPPPPKLTPERAARIARENMQLAGIQSKPKDRLAQAPGKQSAWDVILQWGMTAEHTAAVLAKVEELAAAFTSENPHITPDKAGAFTSRLVEGAKGELKDAIGGGRQTAGGKVGEELVAGASLLFWIILTFGANDVVSELSPEDAKAQIYGAWQRELDESTGLAGPPKAPDDPRAKRMAAENLRPARNGGGSSDLDSEALARENLRLASLDRSV